MIAVLRSDRHSAFPRTAKMEYLIKASYLDTRTGNVHTRTTSDGEILKTRFKSMHPARLLGERVRLENIRISLWGDPDNELGDKSAYIYGDLVADRPIYKTHITVKVRNGEILALKWDGFGESNPVGDPSDWKTMDRDWQRAETRWEQLFNAQQALANVPGSLTSNESGRERQCKCDLSGTLTLTEIGERYRSMGDLLRRTNYDSLYTLTDVEIKGGF